MRVKTKQSVLKNQFSPLTVILLIALCIYVAIIIGLLVWAVSTSFKSWIEFASNVVWFPRFKEGSWKWNYGFVLENLYINSRIYFLVH